MRSALRTLGETAAPLLFGTVSQYVFGGAAGLEYTFLLFLIPLMAAGFLALAGLRTYPRDVATARASIRALHERPAHDRPSDSSHRIFPPGGTVLAARQRGPRRYHGD